MREIWTLPVPSTALLLGVRTEWLPRRCLALSMSYEIDDGVSHATIMFFGVHKMTVTFDRARDPVSLASYDRLMDAGNTQDLVAISRQLTLSGAIPSKLLHLHFNTDDGPHFEVFCEGSDVSIVSETQP